MFGLCHKDMKSRTQGPGKRSPTHRPISADGTAPPWRRGERNGAGEQASCSCLLRAPRASSLAWWPARPVGRPELWRSASGCHQGCPFSLSFGTGLCWLCDHPWVPGKLGATHSLRFWDTTLLLFQTQSPGSLGQQSGQQGSFSSSCQSHPPPRSSST